MLIHPTKNGFNVLNEDGSAHGKRHFVIAEDVRFLIDKEGQNEMVATGRFSVHAWLHGTIIASQYGRVPSEQQYDGWCEVTYRPKAGAHFMMRGDAVDPNTVFPVAVCTTYMGRNVVLVRG